MYFLKIHLDYILEYDYTLIICTLLLVYWRYAVHWIILARHIVYFLVLIIYIYIF